MNLRERTIWHKTASLPSDTRHFTDKDVIREFDLIDWAVEDDSTL